MYYYYNCYSCSFTPPAAPSAAPAMLDVVEIGAHWAVVGWGIPPEAGRNGIIISYIVQLLDTHGAVVRNETVAVQDPTFDSPQSLAHNFTSLKPYTRYLWRVAATTTAGAGPFSLASFHTLQSSELQCFASLFLCNYIPLWYDTLHNVKYVQSIRGVCLPSIMFSCLHPTDQVMHVTANVIGTHYSPGKGINTCRLTCLKHIRSCRDAVYQPHRHDLMNA